jgi:transposase
MTQNYHVGVDISKSKIDCVVLDAELNCLLEKVVGNTQKQIETFFLLIMKKLKITPEKLFVCCENTGIYNRQLEKACVALNIRIWREHAIKIKRASTDMRGKNDRKDAFRIAEYSIRYYDKQKLYKPLSQKLQELNKWGKVRKSLIEQRVAIEQQISEAKAFDSLEYEILNSGYKKVLSAIVTAIKQADEKINAIYKTEEQIAKNIELLQTIPGIGLQCSLGLVLATNNFLDFDSARQLACYAGVVPFQNQSGTITKKERISPQANKNLKKALHLSALAAVRSEPQMKEYFKRKVSEGKNRMSVINAVRNKLVHRVMAVIERQTPYTIMNPGELYQKEQENTCFLT